MPIALMLTPRLATSLSAFLAALFAFALLPASSLSGAELPGRIDLSFGDRGVAVIEAPTAIDPLSEKAIKALMQPDGKMVVAGVVGAPEAAHQTLFVARFLPGGGLDPNFGDARARNGSVLIHTARIWSEGQMALALQPDGKILVCANLFFDPPGDILLLRFHPDGSPDTSFGADGIVRSSPGARHHFNDLVLLADGRIVIGGNRPGGLWLGRFLADGSLDTSFGGTGFVRHTRNTLNNHAGQIAQLRMQPDGRFLIHSLSAVGAIEQFTITRFNPDGTLDTAFGNGGSVGLDAWGSNQWLGSMALLPSGHIVQSVPGQDPRYSPNDFLARYSSTGEFLGYIGAGNTGYSNSVTRLTVLADGTLVGVLRSPGAAYADVVEFGTVFRKLTSVVSHPGNLAATNDGGFLIIGGVNGWQNYDMQVDHHANNGNRLHSYFAELRLPDVAATVRALGVNEGIATVRINTHPPGILPPESWNATFDTSGDIDQIRTAVRAHDESVLHVTHGPQGPVVLSPGSTGWPVPWSSKAPGKFNRPAAAVQHFTSTTCIAENWLGEVFVGGQIADAGVVRRFGLAGARHHKVTGHPAKDATVVVALAPRLNRGLVALVRVTESGTGRLVRLTPQMTTDLGFAQRGQVALDFDPIVLNQGSVAVLPDDRVLLAKRGADGLWKVVCYQNNGQILPGYGDGAGEINTPFVTGPDEQPRTIHLEPLPSGQVIIAGATAAGFAVARWDRNGIVDGGFGTGGLTAIANGVGAGDFVNALRLDAVTGHILVGGATLTSGTGTQYDPFVARFHGDPITCHLTDPRLPPAFARDRTYRQKITVTNPGGALQTGVRVRLHGVPEKVRLHNASRLPETGSWELDGPLSLAPGASQEVVAIYPGLLPSGQRFAPIPRFVPLVEAVVDGQ